ncbi:MAG: hypothetical protein Ct9H300mP28_03720 [Pseudomonadota bacterium]|nr:MAG: hypothetical protein Ct9H300mP28_03720 [Pseudomonadota bacterium]
MMSLLKLLPIPPAEIVSGKATFEGHDLLKLETGKTEKKPRRKNWIYFSGSNDLS